MTTQQFGPIQAVSNKLEIAEERAVELRTRIMEKIAAGESFDQDAISLATAVAAHREILKESNTAALHDETSKLATMILTVVDASPLAELLGENVHSVYLTRVTGDGENEDVISCSINVKARTAPTRTASTNGGTRTSRKTPTFIVDGGESLTAAQFTIQYAPAEIQDNSLMKPDADGKRKWATKPEFLTTTQETLEAMGSVVIRTDPS